MMRNIDYYCCVVITLSLSLSLILKKGVRCCFFFPNTSKADA